MKKTIIWFGIDEGMLRNKDSTIEYIKGMVMLISGVCYVKETKEEWNEKER